MLTQLHKDFAIVDGSLCQQVKKGPFLVFLPVDLDEYDREIEWNEHNIPWAMWQDICAFFRESYKRVKSESLCWLYYSMELKEWTWLVPYQTTNGMSVKVEMDERNTNLRASLHPSFIQIGSIHDHCAGSAFQSGTDHGDEINFDGIHITLGKLDKEELDTHCRVILDKRMMKDEIGNWIDLPESFKEIPPSLRKMVSEKMPLLAGLGQPVPPAILERVQKYAYASGYSHTGTEWKAQVTPLYILKIRGKQCILADNGEMWLESYAQHPQSRRISSGSDKDWYVKFDESMITLNSYEKGIATEFIKNADEYITALTGGGVEGVGDLKKEVADLQKAIDEENAKDMKDATVPKQEQLSLEQTGDKTPDRFEGEFY